MADQELGDVGVGVQRVGGDDRPGKVQPVQQGLEGGTSPGAPSTWRWGEHGAGGMVHRGEQVHLAVVGCAAGAAEGLAVDRDRPSLPSLIMAVAA